MWWADAARAAVVRLGSLPGIRQLLEAKWRTRRSTAQGHAAADKAERLIRDYRDQDRARS